MNIRTLMCLSLTQPGPDETPEVVSTENAAPQPQPKPNKSHKKLFHGLIGVVVILGIVTALALTVFKNPTNYMIAGIYSSMKDYEKAYAMYDALGDYQDSETKALESTYHINVDLMNEGKYDVSCPTFKVLNVLDSEATYKECMYLWGKALLEEDKPYPAYEKFEAIKGYKDTDALIQSTTYTLAGILSEGEEYSVAAYYFGLLGDYEDSDKLFYYNLYKHFVKETEALGYVYYGYIDMEKLDRRIELPEIYDALVRYHYGPAVVYDDVFWPLLLSGTWTSPSGYYLKYVPGDDGARLYSDLPFLEGDLYSVWIIYEHGIWFCNEDMSYCDEWINISFVSESAIAITDRVDDQVYYMMKKP